MVRTTRKLQESRFFLDLLEERRMTPECDFYLSAFVSAARSVIWVMRAECQDQPGWLEWYDRVLPTDQEEVLFRTFNELRVRSEKYRPLETRVAVVLNVPAEAGDTAKTLTKGQKIELIPQSSGSDAKAAGPNYLFSGFVTAMERHLPELEQEDVVVACNRYYEVLERIVADSEKYLRALTTGCSGPE